MKFKKLAALAKAAYEAEKAKADADVDLLAALKEDWEAKQAKADAPDAKDAKKGKADEKAKEGEVKEGTADDGEKVIELDAIKEAISATIKAQLDASLPEHLASQVTPDSLKTLIDAAIKSALNGDKQMSSAQVKTVVADVVTASLKALKTERKHIFEGGGRGQESEDRDMIEVPYALSKGNLPLHMKQLLNCLLRRDANHGIQESMIERGKALGDNLFAAISIKGAKALTSDTSGSGSDWVPRDLASELYRRLYLESQLLQLLLSQEIAMPTDPFDLPLSTTRPTFYKNNVQNRNAQGSTPGTGKFTLTTSKLMALVQYSYEADEESIIPLLPTLQRLLGEAGAAAQESAIINGDTAAAHQDSDIDEQYGAESAFNGLRKLALAVNGLKKDLSTGGISRANLISMKKALGKWGRRPQDLIWITGPLGENDFLNLDEVITADKRGAAGTTVTGTINSYLGTPIVVSEGSREDLNASGVYDGSVTTKGSTILVNKTQWILGSRREFTVEVERNIKSQTNDIVASFRKAFTTQETPSATIKSVAIGYNYVA